MKSKGRRWNYPFGAVCVRPSRSGKERWHIYCRAARRSAGPTGLRLHDLRHPFATRLIQSGVDVFTVQEILAHSAITMTMRYVHSGEAQMRDAVVRLEEKFAQSWHALRSAGSMN